MPVMARPQQEQVPGWWRTSVLAPTVQGVESAPKAVGTALPLPLPGSTGAGAGCTGPALWLTRPSSQLLQGTDVALVCEGPQDVAGHQQDQTDRPGDHQGKGVAGWSHSSRPSPDLSACVRVVATRGTSRGGTPPPSLCPCLIRWVLDTLEKRNRWPEFESWSCQLGDFGQVG